MSKEIKPVDKVTITFDDGNYKIVTSINDDGQETRLNILMDENMPMEYSSTMINIHRIFIDALLNIK